MPFSQFSAIFLRDSSHSCVFQHINCVVLLTVANFWSSSRLRFATCQGKITSDDLHHGKAGISAARRLECVLCAFTTTYSPDARLHAVTHRVVANTLQTLVRTILQLAETYGVINAKSSPHTQRIHAILRHADITTTVELYTMVQDNESREALEKLAAKFAAT